MSEQSKGRKIGGWVIVGLLLALFAFSASGKLTGREPMASHFVTFGLADMRVIIAIGEILSALLYAIPRTSSLGVLLLSAHMGGAICIHMANGELYIVQSIVLLLVWVGQYLRYPELLISFRGASAS